MADEASHQHALDPQQKCHVIAANLAHQRATKGYVDDVLVTADFPQHN